MGGGSDLQQPPSSSSYSPVAIQLKLYQAFIFSIPILFSIILFLLFYLFYLKRRAANFAISSTPPPPLLPRTNNDAANSVADFDTFLRNELKNKLCRVIFDEYVQARELLCCVCLGEFEVKEELLQVASCKHMFHVDCIRHWLENRSTCPLCRAPVNVLFHPQPPQLLPDSSPDESNHHRIEVTPPELTHCISSEGSSSGSGNTC